MSENALACPKCGAKIAADAPQGLCPKCLLQQASFPTEATGSGARFRPEPPPKEALAAAFPHLEIIGLIGRGGMGFVFKARQPKLDRVVALKILAETLSADPSFAERFTREGRALARLSHPNIVTIHDFGQAGPFFYLLMEFIDGVNLRQAMQARQISAAEALAIVPKICEALQYAHGEGILHRDIKPDNILLDGKGRVKIADFGIAKLLNEAGPDASLTGSGATLGTVHYMAPEQIEHPNEVDHRADIYSLGVVFYEMLTGELPIGRFPAPSEKSAVDPRLDKVVFKTLAKEPAKRPQSAGEVGTEVQTISTTARPAAPVTPKTARCYITTPEHLQTWFGRQLLYTGRGELRLEAQQLVWSHRHKPAIIIPLAAITGLTLSEFPRRSKPTGLNYISVTWTEGTRTRRIFLVPNRGGFSFTWTTNEVVAEWFGAIQHAVQSATGSVPPAAKEQTQPLPDAIVPRYGIGFAKSLAFVFVLLLTIWLVGSLFRRPAAVVSYEPQNLVSNSVPVPPPLMAESERAITFYFVEGDAKRISVQSRTEFPRDTEVKPVISYNRGIWAGGPGTSDHYNIERDGTNRAFHATFYWYLPKDFATAFAVSAEVQRISATSLNRALTLSEGAVLEVFTISNKDGQTVSGGIEMKRKVVPSNAEKDSAKLENFRSLTSGGMGIAGYFKTALPPNYRLEAFYTVNGQPMKGSTSWSSSQDRIETRWPFSSQNLYLNDLLARLQEGGPIVVPTNAPVEFFELTTFANERSRDPLKVQTNLVRGMLQLVPIPVSTNGPL